MLLAGISTFRSLFRSLFLRLLISFCGRITVMSPVLNGSCDIGAALNDGREANKEPLDSAVS